MHLILLARYWQYLVIAVLTALLIFATSSCSNKQRNIEQIKAEHELTIVTERAANLAELNQKIQINNERWQSAINQNTRAQKKIADSYVSNTVIVDGLSDIIDKNTADFITANAATNAQYATALATVSKECIGEIKELGRIADGHVADIIMLQKAWPKR